MNKIQFEMVAKAMESQEGGDRFIEGITSGTEKDGQGERMTKEAIASFQDQAMKGDILLYEGKHGVNFIDDIGILVGSFIDDAGDWHTKYRLYKDSDNVGENTIEKANKVWSQINGSPPYNTPRQFGFSIEGIVPQGGIIYADNEGKNRVMNSVTLDGVVLVPRPAYQKSVAAAVQKALDEYEIVQKEEAPAIEVKKSYSFADKIKLRLDKNEYLRKSMLIQDLFEESLYEIAQNSDGRDEKLECLLDEYKEEMKQNIIASWGVLDNFFSDKEMPDYDELEKIYVKNEKKDKLAIVQKKLNDELVLLVKELSGKKKFLL